MNYGNLIKISFRALMNNRLRGFLTMLGVIIGVASVIAMLAIGQGSKASIKNQISEMGSNLIMIQPGNGQFGGVRLSASSMQTLKLADYQRVANEAQYISRCSPIVSSSGQIIYGSNNAPSTITGVNTEYLEIRQYKVNQGEMFTDDDIKGMKKVCVVGTTIVKNLFSNGEDPLGKVIRFNKTPFKIIGILESKGYNSMGMDQDDIILAPYSTVQKRILAITYINSIFASAISEELTDAATESISAILRENHKIREGEEDDFHVRSQEELATMMSSTSDIMTILLACIAGISLLVGGIGIMNIMYVSVTERTREIGLRMSIGAKDIHILLQFLIEAILISVTGGLIGVILGIGSAAMIKFIIGWPVQVQLFSVLISFLVCSLTGVFFGWYPAKKASKLDPIEALRYE
ncbi:MAG TPA: ABC transporter permease [Bacteroidales bacterium]|nr:ABC transporter permease [Bacteroidales bacterium]